MVGVGAVPLHENRLRVAGGCRLLENGGGIDLEANVVLEPQPQDAVGARRYVYDRLGPAPGPLVEPVGAGEGGVNGGLEGSGVVSPAVARCAGRADVGGPRTPLDDRAAAVEGMAGFGRGSDRRR